MPDQERKILVGPISSNPLLIWPLDGSSERVAGTQAFLALSEAIGHADLLVNEGRVEKCG